MANQPIPFFNLPKQCYEEGFTEGSIDFLMDNFTSYKSAMTQHSFGKGDFVYFDYDHNSEQYFFARHFSTDEGCKGETKIFVRKEHIEMAKLSIGNEKLTGELPEKKKKAKKSDGIL